MRIDFFDLEWPRLTSDDLKWPFCVINKIITQSKPRICNGCNWKLTITIWGFEPKYHVMGSRDEKKPTPPLNSFGAKYLIKRLKLISWELSKTQNVETYCFAQILRDWRSLKCSYLFMVVVGGALIGLVGCAKITSFILDWCRHRTLSNTLEISCFLRNSWFLKKKLWFFEKFFWPKKFAEKFYIG